MKKITLVLLVVLAATFAFVGCKTIKTKDSSNNQTSASNQTVASDSQTESDQSTPDSTTQPEPQMFTVTVVGGEGGGSYEEGTEVTVTATVPEGKTFVKWTAAETDVSTDNPYTFTVVADTTLTAVFKDVKYTITVAGGEGGGEYVYGAEVTVTATVPEGKTFVKWMNGEEDVSTDNPYVFTVTADMTLTAVFENDARYFAASENYTFTNEEEKSYKKLRFDYKITSAEGTYFQVVILNSAWSAGYGYIKFDSTGAIENGNGVTCLERDDGFVSVTIDLTQAVVFGESVPEGVCVFYLRGDWSDASGYIENVSFSRIFESMTVTAPTKTNYLFGDQLDLTGATVTLNYDDGYTAEVEVTAGMITGFDATTAGEQTVTVTYAGLSATFTVTVSVPSGTDPYADDCY